MTLDAYAELMQPGEPLDLMAALVTRPEWHDGAECRRYARHVDFYPAAPARGIKPDPGPALAICRRCPVKGPCLAWALEHDESGVWGATTEDERKAMRQAA